MLQDNVVYVVENICYCKKFLALNFPKKITIFDFGNMLKKALLGQICYTQVLDQNITAEDTLASQEFVSLAIHLIPRVSRHSLSPFNKIAEYSVQIQWVYTKVRTSDRLESDVILKIGLQNGSPKEHFEKDCIIEIYQIKNIVWLMTMPSRAVFLD